MAGSDAGHDRLCDRLHLHHSGLPPVLHWPGRDGPPHQLQPLDTHLPRLGRQVRGGHRELHERRGEGPGVHGARARGGPQEVSGEN